MQKLRAYLSVQYAVYKRIRFATVAKAPKCNRCHALNKCCNCYLYRVYTVFAFTAEKASDVLYTGIERVVFPF